MSGPGAECAPGLPLSEAGTAPPGKAGLIDGRVLPQGAYLQRMGAQASRMMRQTLVKRVEMRAQVQWTQMWMRARLPAVAEASAEDPGA